MSVFQKASKARKKLRLGIAGPSGSGKTYTALALAAGLGGPVAVIDTEHGSASLYSDDFDFDTVELPSSDPRVYIEHIRAAEAGGYSVLVIDSLSR
jgi:tRNA A37 N6-isopentenylltransferase MiaA